jgi:hypothetical protein
VDAAVTVRNPLVLIPNGNPQIQELPAGDSISGVLAGTTATGPTGAAGVNGSSALQYTVTIGDGSSTSIAVTHNLGTRDVVVSMEDSATFAYVAPVWTATSASVVTLTFSPAPAVNKYNVLVIAGRAVGSGSTLSPNVYFA